MHPLIMLPQQQGVKFNTAMTSVFTSSQGPCSLTAALSELCRSIGVSNSDYISMRYFKTQLVPEPWRDY